MLNRALLALVAACLIGGVARAQTSPLKTEVVGGVEARAKLGQQMNDSSSASLNWATRKSRTARYVTATLEQNGFKVVRGVSGIPTAWVATWTNGSGGPVIALGSDVDGIPTKPPRRPASPGGEPMVEGAPGHGEGHNSGQAVNGRRPPWPCRT